MKEMSVNTYMVAKSKYFNASALPVIRSIMTQLPDEAQIPLEAVELKDPTVSLIISLLIGGLGIDRFMIGDTTMGIVKLLTAGGCGVLTIIDWFTIMGKTRSKNYEKFMAAASAISPQAQQIVYSADPTPETDDEAEARGNNF